MPRTDLAKHHNEIESPAENETITTVFYNIRVASGEAGRVELSIDGSVWHPCRYDADHWEYEWSDYRPGEHQIRVQFFGADDKVLARRSRQVRHEPVVD